MSSDFDADEWAALSSLLDEVLKLPVDERPAWLDALRARNPGQHTSLLRLLAADADAAAAAFLESPAVVRAIEDAPASDSDGSETEGIGDATAASVPPIGPYRLLRKLGEGGMGEVWLAEQTAPVQRRVALKLVKAGMDTRQVIARFEAERQALAVMDHPTIAKVFDAGETTTGRPYFVMEYVKGEPITAYCDRRRLSMIDRIALFLQVCEGVQHAHQKGIIHRDLKPSNILVETRDDKALPRIIDFGVAKATAQRLTEKTLVTELGAMIGTPEYMSPEQVEVTGLDVDTRTDVYSLGVVLYELLVGALPFDSRDLRRVAIDEVRRLIREVDPPRPSVRASAPGDATLDFARNRGTEPKRLAGLLRGDLDWITMKALEKDRTRRYSSPSELAADLTRHLDDLPVIAGPPSVTYRARKFVRRHRVGVAMAALVSTALTAAAVVSTLLYLRSEESREEATAVAQFLGGMFADVSPSLGSKDITVREVLDRASTEVGVRFKGKPLVEAYLHQVMASSYGDLGVRTEAERHARAAVKIRCGLLGEEDPSCLQSMLSLASVLRIQGKLTEVNALLDELIPMSDRNLGEESRETLGAMYEKAIVLVYQGRFAEGETLHRRVYEIRRRLLGDDHPDTLKSAYWLAQSALRLGRAPEAEIRLREVLRRSTLGPEHPGTLECMNILCWALNAQGKHAEAEEVLKQVLGIRRRVLGDGHPDTVKTLYDLACVSATRGDKHAALELLRQAIEGGYANVLVLRTDPDIASLRRDPEFDRLLATAESNAVKLGRGQQ